MASVSPSETYNNGYAGLLQAPLPTRKRVYVYDLYKHLNSLLSKHSVSRFEDSSKLRLMTYILHIWIYRFMRVRRSFAASKLLLARSLEVGLAPGDLASDKPQLVAPAKCGRGLKYLTYDYLISWVYAININSQSASNPNSANTLTTEM